MTEYELAVIKRNSELAIWAGGLALELVCILAALAWAVPLLFFDTLERQPGFYGPMLYYGSSLQWGMFAMLAVVLNTTGVVLFLLGGVYYRPLRVLGGAALIMFFGAISGTMIQQNWHVAAPYLHGVLTTAAAVSTASALVEFTGSRTRG